MALGVSPNFFRLENAERPTFAGTACALKIPPAEETFERRAVPAYQLWDKHAGDLRRNAAERSAVTLDSAASEGRLRVRSHWNPPWVPKERLSRATADTSPNARNRPVGPSVFGACESFPASSALTKNFFMVGVAQW